MEQQESQPNSEEQQSDSDSGEALSNAAEAGGASTAVTAFIDTDMELGDVVPDSVDISVAASISAVAVTTAVCHTAQPRQALADQSSPAPTNVPAIPATSPPPQDEYTQAERMKQEFYFPPLASGCTQRVEDKYELLEKIGEGTYGCVYYARNRQDRSMCALKKMKLDNYQEGFPLTSVREIKIAQRLSDHRNIVTMKEILISEDEFAVLVFEYVEYDLAGIMLARHKLSTRHIIAYFFQVLNGLLVLHRKGIIHRDLKASNVLVTKDGTVKLCDFGLSRTVSSGDKVTPEVVTMWYRPPEILLDGSHYDTQADMWSAGCLLAEMFLGEPLFRTPVAGVLQQLEKITGLCGSPNELDWPGVSQMKRFAHVVKGKRRILKPWLEERCKFVRQSILDKRGKGIPDQALDLVDKLLTLDPNKRPPAKSAIEHGLFYFVEVGNTLKYKEGLTDPIPLEIKGHEQCHEWQMKQQLSRQREQHAHRYRIDAKSQQLHRPINPAMQKGAHGKGWMGQRGDHAQGRLDPTGKGVMMQRSQSAPPRPKEHHPPSGPVPQPHGGGDWVCSSCQFMNQGKHDTYHCQRCKAPRQAGKWQQVGTVAPQPSFQRLYNGKGKGHKGRGLKRPRSARPLGAKKGGKTPRQGSEAGSSQLADNASSQDPSEVAV